MANNNRWGDFKGWVANQLASGNVYDTNTNSYAPQNVMNTRLASGVVSNIGGPAGALLGMGGRLASNRMDGAQRFDRRMQMPLTRESYNPSNPGVTVSDIGGNAPGGIGALQGGFGGGPSAFGTAGYHYANPQGQTTGQAPGGFANGIFNGGQGNFGPTGGNSGGAAAGSMGGGGGGARGAFTFGGYANDAHRDASIAGAQEQFAAMKMGDLNKNFQTGRQNSVFGGGGIYEQ